MQIRAYTQDDLPELRRIYKAQGFAYEFPDLENATYFIKLVGVDENGKIVAAAIAHLTAEIFFLLDPKDGTPKERMERFEQMETHGRSVAWYPGGLDDLHAFLPPKVEKSFGKRLMRRGWFKALWTCYAAEL